MNQYYKQEKEYHKRLNNKLNVTDIANKKKMKPTRRSLFT